MNNILNVKRKPFIKKKETKIIEIKFKAKTWIILETGTLTDFKSYCMTIKAEFIIVIWKYQI